MSVPEKKVKVAWVFMSQSHKMRWGYLCPNLPAAVIMGSMEKQEMDADIGQ